MAGRAKPKGYISKFPTHCSKPLKWKPIQSPAALTSRPLVPDAKILRHRRRRKRIHLSSSKSKVLHVATMAIDKKEMSAFKIHFESTTTSFVSMEMSAF